MVVDESVSARWRECDVQGAGRRPKWSEQVRGDEREVRRHERQVPSEGRLMSFSEL